MLRDGRAPLPLLRPGVDSAPESWLRLLIVDGGLPEPEVNQWIVDADGRRVSRPDLQYRAQRIALEYEGEHHLTWDARPRRLTPRRDCRDDRKMPRSVVVPAVSAQRGGRAAPIDLCATPREPL